MKDLLLGADLDLQLSGNDLALGESTAQNKHLLLVLAPGHVRADGYAGANLRQFINDDLPLGMLQSVQAAFERDGLTVEGLKLLADGTLTDSSYYADGSES